MVLDLAAAQESDDIVDLEGVAADRTEVGIFVECFDNNWCCFDEAHG